MGYLLASPGIALPDGTDVFTCSYPIYFLLCLTLFLGVFLGFGDLFMYLFIFTFWLLKFTMLLTHMHIQTHYAKSKKMIDSYFLQKYIRQSSCMKNIFSSDASYLALLVLPLTIQTNQHCASCSLPFPKKKHASSVPFPAHSLTEFLLKQLNNLYINDTTN